MRQMQVIDTAKRDLAICRMYRAGAGVRECGKVHKISNMGVTRILRRHGVETRKPGKYKGWLAANAAAVKESFAVMDVEVSDDRSEFEKAMRFPGTMRAFARLDDDAQMRVRKAFERHRRACESVGCGIDPGWMSEAIYDAHREQARRERAAA